MTPLSRYKMQHGAPRPAPDAQPIEEDIYANDETPGPGGQPRPYMGPPQQMPGQPPPGPVMPSSGPMQGAPNMPPEQNQLLKQPPKLPNTKRSYM